MVSSRSAIKQMAIRASFFANALAGLLLLLAGTVPSQAQAPAVSEPDQQCLACHGSAGLEKKLENSETLELHVPAEGFAASVHSAIGCAACHSDISLDSHPPSKKAIKTSREYSVASAEVCKTCHAEKFDEWEKSIHASLVRDGNPIAPVCTDCHAPHAVIKGAAESLDTVPCKTCHGAIFTAYQDSVHGKARVGGNVGAPVCSGCHQAHEVTAASTGDAVKNACLGCHADALEAHQAWLPNAGLHFEVVSCPACHSPNSERRVDLRLTDSATQTRVSEQQGVPQFESRARSASNGQGLDAVALYNLLKTFNREGMEGKTTLRGRLEVRTGAEAHQLASKSAAISDCRTCHRQGSDAFQSVTVSVVGPDGRPIRVGAEKDVLSSVFSIDSVGGFYAIGGTRIQILDILVVLALLGGLSIPIGHMTLGWFLRQSLNRHDQSKKAGS